MFDVKEAQEKMKKHEEKIREQAIDFIENELKELIKLRIEDGYSYISISALDKSSQFFMTVESIFSELGYHCFFAGSGMDLQLVISWGEKKVVVRE